MPVSPAQGSAGGPTIHGRAGARYPPERIALPVIIFVIVCLAYAFEGRISSTVPSLIPYFVPGLGFAILALWTSIIIFGKGPPDHLRAVKYVGMPVAITVFALEGFGLWFMGWAGVLQIIASGAGGLQGVPSPENWMIPTASGAIWLGSSIVIVGLTTMRYLFPSLHGHGKGKSK